jgi:hypothetical protein
MLGKIGRSSCTTDTIFTSCNKKKEHVSISTHLAKKNTKCMFLRFLEKKKSANSLACIPHSLLDLLSQLLRI